MHGCSCPHSVSEHGSPKQFGQHLCLVAGCNCNGTSEEIVTAAVQRSMAKRRAVHDITDLIRETMTSPRVPIYTDNMAHEVALAICERFIVEKK